MDHIRTRRSVISLIWLLTASLLAPVAAARVLVKNPTGPTPVGAPAGGSQPVHLPELPAGHILYDQTDNPGTILIGSQEFELANSIYDDQAADDFVVPAAGDAWTIGTVYVRGSYFNGNGPAPTVHVYFYADEDGLPGTQVYAGEDLSSKFDAEGSLTIFLGLSPAILSPGTYWLSVQARMDSNNGGQWGWIERAVQSYSASVWRNPADGYGTGCTDWTDRLSCGVGSEPDLLFALGSQFPLLLPVARHNYCVAFPGPMEEEPNDASILANGPLCFDYPYTGSPVDDLPGAEEDWFFFDWDGSGTVKIDVQDFLADAQVLLYYQTGNSDFIARDYAQPDGHYEITCGPTCSLGRGGKYLIRVFAPEDRPTTPTLYTLRVTLLP